jgi:tRNA-Thr(GGU) m(6)t(6)A37 methyltransferase TsaA
LKSKIILKSIGKVQNDFREDNIGKHLARRVLMLSRLVIDGRFKAALEGIESYSHLIIIYYMHKVTGTKGLKINSQGRKEIAKVGFFATRSPNRPNPIGVTVVKLLERRQNIVKIRGLYAINGTPILDIKPYTYTDRKGTIRVPVCERRIFYKDS